MQPNPNVKQRPFQPADLSKSRHMPGRANPGGYGVERLMGNVPQPLKNNALPGYGTTAPDPVLAALLRHYRTVGLPPAALRARERMRF